MADSLPPIERPNGKLYRPRKIRVVGFEFDDWYDLPPQTAVLGTHDIDEARKRVSSGHTCYYLTNPRAGWIRLGPCDGELKWIDDPERGAACVIFDESDDPPEDTAAVRGGQQ